MKKLKRFKINIKYQDSMSLYSHKEGCSSIFVLINFCFKDINPSQIKLITNKIYPICTALEECESVESGLYENKNNDKKVNNPLKISCICV